MTGPGATGFIPSSSHEAGGPAAPPDPSSVSLMGGEGVAPRPSVPDGRPSRGSHTGFLAQLAATPPRHPWWPASVVSLVFPSLGLLFLRNRTRLAFAVFGAWLAAHIVLRTLIGWTTPVVSRQLVSGAWVDTLQSGSPFFATVFTILWWFVTLLFAVGAMVYTHDETVRDYPALGETLVFKQPLTLPAALRG